LKIGLVFAGRDDESFANSKITRPLFCAADICL
jgi:hypothetical protein